MLGRGDVRRHGRHASSHFEPQPPSSWQIHRPTSACTTTSVNRPYLVEFANSTIVLGVVLMVPVALLAALAAAWFRRRAADDDLPDEPAPRRRLAVVATALVLTLLAAADLTVAGLGLSDDTILTVPSISAN